LILVEAAVDTLRSALSAERAGAGRIELCVGLSDGGITPSHGLISSVVTRARIPVFVLIRPRGGSFVYSDDEMEIMRSDIALAHALRARGIVTGALRADNRVDVEKTRVLVEAAAGLPVTFHRALDFTPNLGEALEQLIEAGVSRVLTSGGASTALEGAHAIASLVQQARGRIILIAGGGIREHNVAEVVAQTGVREVHSRIGTVLRRDIYSGSADVRLRKPLPEDESAWEELDEERMRSLVAHAQTEGKIASGSSNPSRR
jgi:copper homeostasis protein